MYQCPQCKSIFKYKSCNRKSDYLVHVGWRSIQIPVICDFCNYSIAPNEYKNKKNIELKIIMLERHEIMLTTQSYLNKMLAFMKMLSDEDVLRFLTSGRADSVEYWKIAPNQLVPIELSHILYAKHHSLVFPIECTVKTDCSTTTVSINKAAEYLDNYKERWELLHEQYFVDKDEDSSSTTDTLNKDEHMFDVLGG